MNILPKQYSQFKQKGYWDHFFKELQQKQKPFDWYGTLQAYRHPLFFSLNAIYNLNNKEKRINIAHLGCGNSTLQEDILKAYPVFDFKIVNLDYSENVIQEMKDKCEAKKLTDKLEYHVCDLLKEVGQEFIGKFEVILDKGTLDAILPQDKAEDIAEIKKVYFKNAIKMLNPNKHGRYIIISMLQQFILRTILEEFHSNPNFSITITQCAIPDSQLQPFLIDLIYTPQPHDPLPIKLTLLTKATVLLESSEAAIKKIAELQQLAVYTGSIRNLRPGQIVKFNLHAPNTHRFRYMLDVSDSNIQSALIKNNCAVFIVPPGLEAQFAGETAIRQIHTQVGTSRLIVAKLVVGESAKSVQEVKDELNPVLPNIIQKGCKLNEVPYLTDGTFTERQYLFRDEEIFIEEILQNGQSYRRLILKNSPSLIQSQLKLTYFAQKNRPDVKNISSLTLPSKKGFLPGIDRSYLDEGYCRTILTGLSRLVPKGLQHSQSLHLGGGAAAISTFLHHKYSQARQTIVEINKSVVINCGRFFQWPQKDPRFTVVNKQAGQFISDCPKENQYDFIIVDISNDEEKEGLYPPRQFSQQKFIKQCLDLLNDGGVLVYNTINLEKSEKGPDFCEIFDSFKQIGLIYRSITSSENQVYFAVKANLPAEQREGKNVIVAKNLLRSESNILQIEWQEEYLKDLELVRPVSGKEFKKVGIQAIVEEQEKKKKKKKKK